MSHHEKMPPVPSANRSPKGAGESKEIKGELDIEPRKKTDNFAEQGETGNIRQNTINAGYFHGRRVK